MKKYFLLLLLSVNLLNSVNCQTNIFAYGSEWKYSDDGTNQGTVWTAIAFNDSAWAIGKGQLGYGDGDEATITGFGDNINFKHITTYFRKTISIANPAGYSSFTANVKRDDGIIIYINGTEVYRNNIAAGPVTFTSLAELANDDGSTPQTFLISPGAFVKGNNVIAVEIHQNTATSSDISFDMELLCIPVKVNTDLILYGSSWKYKDNGTNQGTGWRATTFNDDGWSVGKAPLGYGDGDENTVVGYGLDADSKYITSYFRKEFTIADTALYTGYHLNIKRDDGAIVYINGLEVFRSNMPSGNIRYTTYAAAIASDDGNTEQKKVLTISQLKKGTNVIAVEIHQNLNTSSDISFDLQLTAIVNGSTSVPLTRGPYLNSVLQNGIVIRWRSELPSNSKVSYGTKAGRLTQSFIDTSITTEHVVTLAGLTANTLYYYSIGSTTQTLQGDSDNHFKTLPVAGSTQKIRILAMGDMGDNSSNQANVLSAWQKFNGNNYTDAWLLLGDNAYESGTDEEYQANLFNVYQGNLSKNHVIWPVPGNHDYANDAARQADHLVPYYDIFTLPKNGEAGGVASNTEAYYSFNYGNVHFVALDSYGWEKGRKRLYDTLSPQVVWLKKDLGANTKQWTVVFFHHPPFSKGSHNSDTEPELINIRRRIVPILERYKVDLVLNGHSHGYERSYFLNGYYGFDSTFNIALHTINPAGAKYAGTANNSTYIKNTADARNGIVYVVSGSAGQLGEISEGYPHNAMNYSNATMGGAFYFEVENNRLSAKWICADKVIRDQFTIIKNANQTNNITIASGKSAILTASWIGSYSWSTGESTRSITISPGFNTTYSVMDGISSLSDVFNIVVTSN